MIVCAVVVDSLVVEATETAEIEEPEPELALELEVEVAEPQPLTVSSAASPTEARERYRRRCVLISVAVMGTRCQRCLGALWTFAVRSLCPVTRLVPWLRSPLT
ncbi:hypothetical protein GCM10027456_42850 [Kineosporia babensis]